MMLKHSGTISKHPGERLLTTMFSTDIAKQPIPARIGTPLPFEGTKMITKHTIKDSQDSRPITRRHVSV